MKLVSALIALTLAASSVFGSETCTENKVPTGEPSWECKGARCVLTLNWQEAESKGSYRIDEKFLKGRPAVTSQNVLVIEVHRFNFLRWGLEFEVQEKVIESYVYLEKLWKQITLISDGINPNALPAPGFFGDLLIWKDKIRSSNDDLDAVLKAYPRAALTGDEVSAICGKIDGVETRRAQLVDAWTRVRGQVDDAAKLALFEATEEKHRQTLERLDAFVSTARLIRDGFSKTIPKKDSGRIVTVTIKPKTLVGSQEGAPVVVEYFVHSELGLTYHVGLAYSKLGEVKFQPVRTLSGADLFAKVKEADSSTELGAFLSLPITIRVNEGRGVQLFGTLGTDIGDPGKKIYAGLSIPLPIRRAMLTAGFVSGTVDKEGNKIVDQVVDAAGNVIGTRDLFDTFKSRREWKFAFAVSFRPF